MSDWQPIETAPKNDQRILVFNEMVGVYSSNLENGEYLLHYWDGQGVWYPKPTHWMPLPSPPNGEANRE